MLYYIVYNNIYIYIHMYTHPHCICVLNYTCKL